MYIGPLLSESLLLLLLPELEPEPDPEPDLDPDPDPEPELGDPRPLFRREPGEVFFSLISSNNTFTPDSIDREL